MVNLKSQIFWWISFVYLQWAIWLVHHQKHYKIPTSSSRSQIFSIVLSNYVKSYEYICSTLTLFYTAWNKFTQFYIYTYMNVNEY
jgi:phosphate/sulfate permease